jgi:hypothetical protein
MFVRRKRTKKMTMFRPLELDEDQVAADSIHPFANGNGRTARLWVNSISMRYNLPPFLRLRPRPDAGYGDAGAEAMRGNWQPTIAMVRRHLEDFLHAPASK